MIQIDLLYGVFAAAFLFQLPILPALPVLPNPDPASIQPFLPTSSPATIPAFPEQSDIVGCPLDLPEQLFEGISTACGGKNGKKGMSKSRCCPVLAAWLYAAYAGTALGRAVRVPTASYDMPLLPDDSETCVGNLEKALKGKGIELRGPNDTCDVVYCYCGIKLHAMSCPEAFTVSEERKLIGNARVKKMETDCRGSSLAGCSKCLKSLYQLNGDSEGVNASKSDRKSKIRNRNCELMGLTWLLAKNRTSYVSTVSAVLRALMMNGDDSNPISCSLNTDGMPLAVDSAELDSQSSSYTLRFPLHRLLSLYWIFVIFWTRF